MTCPTQIITCPACETVPLRGGDGGVELGDEPEEELAVESLAQRGRLVVRLLHRLQHHRGSAVHLSNTRKTSQAPSEKRRKLGIENQQPIQYLPISYVQHGRPGDNNSSNAIHLAGGMT